MFWGNMGGGGGGGGGGGNFVPRSEFQALEKRVQRAEMAIVNQDMMLKQLQQMLSSRVPGLGSGDRDRSRTPRMWNGEKPLLPEAAATDQMSLEEFAIQNSLDQKCIENLRSQPIEVQNFVIGQGIVDGKNPSAMVMSRIQRCTSEYRIPIQDVESIQQKVDDFIMNNGLDENCAAVLRKQTPDCQVAVLSLGPTGEGRNPSAMVQGRIAKFVRGRL